MDWAKALCWVVIVSSVVLAGVMLCAWHQHETVAAQAVPRARCEAIHDLWDAHHGVCLQVIRP